MEKIEAYLYIRYSSDKTVNVENDRQIDEFLKKYSMYEITKKFTDSPDTDDKGIIDLMNFARIEKTTRKVVAYSRSNISMDEVFVMWIEKELFKYNATIRYIVEEYLDNNELEVIRDKIIGAFARYENEKLPNKLAAHREYKIFETRMKASGNCPIGYRYFGKNTKEKKVIVIAQEAELVRSIFEKYLELKSLGKLKEYLDENSSGTRRGKKFSRQALYNILTNKFYIGLLSYNHYKYIDVTGQNRRKAILIEERRVEGKHERFVPKELFDHVNELLTENNKHKFD